MKNISIIELAWELHESRVSTEDIALRIGHHRATVYRWFKGIKLYGIREYLRRYQQAKKGRRQKRKTNPIIKARIYAIRDKYSNCCGEKIRYWMFKEYGIKISISTIYRILGQKYQLRSKWKKNEVRGPIPKASKQREVIQHDTVDFGEVFAFTGIDIFTKEADVVIFPSLTSHEGLIYLETSMKRRFDNHSDLIQTDGGPEFKNEFKANVHRFSNRHRVARPYKKNEQSFIESFNRSLRKECLGWIKYKPNQVDYLNNIVINYLERYHYHRPHIGLGMKPPLERV